MNMKKINLFVILFTFLGIGSNAFAAWEGSGEGTNVGGTWYVLYNQSGEINTIGSKEFSLSGPGAQLTFTGTRSMRTGVGKLKVTDGVNSSLLFDENPGEATWGGVNAINYGPFNVNVNATTIKFYTETGATYKKQFSNVNVTMAQYIENPSITNVALGTGLVNSADASSSTAIAWCNIPAMTYEITGEDKGQFSVSVAGNAAAGKYGTATFTVKYKHDKVGEHTATLTVKDSYGNYNKSVSLSGETVKNDNAISWNAAEGWKDWNETLTINATSNNTDEGAVINFESSNTEYASIADGVITFHEAGAGKSVTIKATQAESAHFKAAAPVVKTFHIKSQQVLVWDAEVVNPNMSLGANRDITGYAVPQLETVVPVVYASANTDIISVEGNTLTANAVGEVLITASIAASEQHRAAEISKTFVVKEKESVVVKQGDAIIEQNGVLTLHLGEESGVVTSSNTANTLQVQIANEAVARYNTETKKIEAVAVGQTTLTLTQEAIAEYLAYKNEVTLKVELVENTLAVAAAEVTKYVDEELADFIIAGNSDAAISVESSDPTIAYYDAEAGKVLIPNSEAKSFKETLVTITVSQPATATIGAAEKQIALTVKKYENVIKVNGQTNYAATLAPAHTLAVAFTANNPAGMDSIAQERGEKNATLADGKVSANYITGTAEWSLFQFETYKYQEAKATFTVKVERQAEATDCEILYVKEEGGAKLGNYFHEHKWDADNIAGVLTFEAKKGSDISVGVKLSAEELVDGVWTDVQGGSYNSDDLKTSYAGKKLTLNPKAKGIRFYSAGSYQNYVKEIHITRYARLSAGAAEFNVLPTEVGEATIKVDYSLANGGDLKIVSDKDYFTFEPSVISNVDCKNGSANVKVRFTAPEEEGDHLANITVFNGVYSATAQVVGHVKKVTPAISWNDFAMPFGENVALGATADPAADILYELVDAETNVLHIEDGKIYADNAGTAQVKAYIESSVKFNVTEKVITVTVNQAQQTIEWTQELPEIKAGDEPFQLVATASSGLDVTFESSDPTIAYIDAENKLHAVATGEITIVAKQAGTDNIAAVETAPRALTILPGVDIDPVEPGDTRKKQTIVWDVESLELTLEADGMEIYAITQDASTNADLELEVYFVSSDSTVAYVENDIYGTILAVKKAGTVVITAVQEGNATYQPAYASKTFTITDPSDPGTATACEEIEGAKAVKIFRDGQIFILRANKVYTASGLLVK